MLAKRHSLFNIALIVIPWLTVLFLGKRPIKRYSIAGFSIVLLELLYQVVGQRRNWWVFYDRLKSFMKDVFPFAIGPYMPMSLWLLRLSYGNFTKFVLLNIIGNILFAYPGIMFLKKIKVANLHRLSSGQFFIYLFHKALILYGIQLLVERKKQSK